METRSTTAFTAIAWLSLIGASSAVSLAHAEDPFEGHRLFFTQAQRTDAILKESDVLHGVLSDTSNQEIANTEKKPVSGARESAIEGSIDPLDTRQGRASAAGQEGFTNNFRVYFTGLVTGVRQARILVNGLPCEFASVTHNVEADQPVLINCHGIRDDALRLTMSIASGTLMVTDAAGRVHQLSPGEGM